MKLMMLFVAMFIVTSGSAWAIENRSNVVISGEQKECSLMAAKHVQKDKIVENNDDSEGTAAKARK